MTPVKIWFKPSKTEGLSLTDANVLNTAARLLSSTPGEPSEADLAEMRKAYSF
jgi:hypothetical protein